MIKITEILEIFKKNKDAKTVASNFVWLTILQFTSYLFPLFTIPYLAKVIGAYGFGKIAFASAIMVWFQTITNWGFNFTATRDVAQNKNDKTKVSEILSNVLWGRCILIAISFILLSILVFTIPTFKENADIIFLTFLIIPGHTLYPDWFFQAIERMRYITILTVLIRAIFTVAIFLFIKDSNDYILQPILLTFGYTISGIIALYIITVKWKYKINKPNRGALIYLKKSADVFINCFMPILYDSMSIVLIGFFTGSVANGIFDAANKFISLTNQMLHTISRAFFPFLSRKIEKHNLYHKIYFSISVLIAIILIVFSPIIINLFYTPEFNSSIIILQVLAISIIFSAIYNIYGTNYLIILKEEIKLRNATALASIIGFIIAFPLIYLFNALGAAITITFTRGILGLFTYIQARKSRIQ